MELWYERESYPIFPKLFSNIQNKKSFVYSSHIWKLDLHPTLKLIWLHIVVVVFAPYVKSLKSDAFWSHVSFQLFNVVLTVSPDM